MSTAAYSASTLRDTAKELLPTVLRNKGYIAVNRSSQDIRAKPRPPPMELTTEKVSRPASHVNVSTGSPGKANGLKPNSRDTTNIGNSTSESRRQTLAYELVVSHFNENLDWLKPFAKEAGHVYHKGPAGEPPFEIYKWENVPNVGREAHTYLYHILKNYDHLADVTVFLQGHGSYVDRAWCFAQPMDFVTNAKKNNFCKRDGRFGGWGRIHHFGKWLAALNAGRMRRAKLTVGDFYKAVFGTAHPALVPVCFAGCFAATRDNLRRHPTSFYQKAISFLSDHSDPEEAHYMERLWATIINVQ